MSRQIEKIIEEFTKQAESFDHYQKTFSKEEYNRFAIDHIGFGGEEQVLEVAAGTCAFGRSVAPYVAHITELDVTEAMLEVGRSEAKKQGITNVSFMQGAAEKLPFQAESFDCVMSRLAFHHFEDINAAYGEMERVLKSEGKLVIIDMEARDEQLRQKADYYEQLRDPSHVRCISKDEFYQIAEKHHIKVTFCQTIAIPVSLEAWMNVTKVPQEKRSVIIRAMEQDIKGQEPTGFEPYEKEGQIYFNHKWMLVIAEK